MGIEDRIMHYVMVERTGSDEVPNLLCLIRAEAVLMGHFSPGLVRIELSLAVRDVQVLVVAPTEGIIGV